MVFCLIMSAFEYANTKRQALEDINLDYSPRRSCRVSRRENGSGKTTLIKLLCRLLQPYPW